MVSLQDIEKQALTAIGANNVNSLNRASYDAMLDNLKKLNGFIDDTGIKADYNGFAKVSASASADIKPTSKALVYAKYNKQARTYPVNTDFTTDNALQAFFHYNLNKAIVYGFLNGLCAKGNDTTFKLKTGACLPYDIEDLLSTLSVYACENADGLSLNGDTVKFNDTFILGAFKALSADMYRQATRSNKAVSLDNLIHEALASIEWSDGTICTDTITHEAYIQDCNALLAYDAKVIISTIKSTYKPDTANDVITLFKYRLQGLRFKDIQALTGLTHDRIKYCQRLLVKVGQRLDYNMPCFNSTYTVKPAKTHDIIVKGKRYTVTTVKPVNRKIVNRFTVKPVKPFTGKLNKALQDYYMIQSDFITVCSR